MRADRFNQGKPKFSLLPFDALEALATHFTRGAEKYSARNWERGMPYSEVVDSLMRHLSAWWQGETYDKEGFRHTTAIAWNAIALLTYDLRGMSKWDDRPPKIEPAYGPSVNLREKIEEARRSINEQR